MKKIKIDFLLVRALLKLITFPFSLDNSEIQLPSEYKAFDGVPPKDIQHAISCSYKELFSGPPFYENWDTTKVIKKLNRELNSNKFSFLTIMKGDNQFPVAGFCWGTIVDCTEIPQRISLALALNKNNKSLELIEKYLKKRKVNKILYFDELGIIKRFRGGTDPLRFLTLPGFQKAKNNNVNKAMFWSSPHSKIVPIMRFMGFEPIAKIKVGMKKIVFLYSPNFKPLLKISKNIPHKQTTAILKIASLIT